MPGRISGFWQTVILVSFLSKMHCNSVWINQICFACFIASCWHFFSRFYVWSLNPLPSSTAHWKIQSMYGKGFLDGGDRFPWGQGFDEGGAPPFPQWECSSLIPALGSWLKGGHNRPIKIACRKFMHNRRSTFIFPLIYYNSSKRKVLEHYSGNLFHVRIPDIFSVFEVK